MSGTTRQYDPAEVIFNFDGKDASGFADGTFIKVERNVELWTTVVGSDGEVTRVKSANRSGRYTLTLQQSSPFNDVLSAYVQQDQASNSGAKAVLVKDILGTMLCSSKKAWVIKPAPIERAKEASNVEWIIESGQVDMTVGGNTEA
jgi:hypothetical protein